MNTQRHERRQRLIGQALSAGMPQAVADRVVTEALRIEAEGGVFWFGGQEQRRWAENTVEALCWMANKSLPTAVELADRLASL